MVFAEIDFVYILPIAIFGLFAAGAWWALDRMTRRRPRAEERLADLKNPGKRKEEGASRRGDAMAKVLERATPALAKPLSPKDEVEVGKLKQKLSMAGFRAQTAVSTFLGLKFLGLVVGLVFGGGTFLSLSGITQNSLMGSVFVAGVMFYLPDLAVAIIASSRRKNIFLGLPDALDLLVVCVESGLGLDQAMRKVAEESKRTCGVIAEEFSLSNFQLQMGRNRSAVLHELGHRTGVDDLRSLAAILIQADKFGSSVAQALRVQSDSMRTRRRQLAEEKAAKTAVKLIFPLVIFIFPGIFVVLVGPAAITMVREMFPAMNK